MTRPRSPKKAKIGADWSSRHPLRQNVAARAKMNVFLLFLPAAVLAASSSEGRVRRQIWPAPANPNFFWDRPRNVPDFFDDRDFWPGTRRFDQPQRTQDFDGFASGGGRNQNARTTTESMGPITSTPRTIHYAPRGCDCPMTQQFNPVCGTDGNTYRNTGLLNCYRRCGSNVSPRRLGTC